VNIAAPFDSNFHLLNKVLDLRAEKQRVIGSNIANAETPGYAKATYSFEDNLRNAISRESAVNLETTHSSHIPLYATSIDAVQGEITREPDNTGIGDENSVSVDSEMIDMSKNQLMYETAAKLLKKKLTVLKYAISEGK